MAAGTRATADDMRSTAAEVDRLDSETQAELRRLQSEAQTLRGNWTSLRSGKSFDDTMARWNSDAAVMQRAMQDIAKLMRATATQYDNLEQDSVDATRVHSDGSRNYSI